MCEYLRHLLELHPLRVFELFRQVLRRIFHLRVGDVQVDASRALILVNILIDPRRFTQFWLRLLPIVIDDESANDRSSLGDEFDAWSAVVEVLLGVNDGLVLKPIH